MCHRKAHSDVVSTLFKAGTRITDLALEFLPGEDLKQSPLVIRHYLDHGIDPNVRLSRGAALRQVITKYLLRWIFPHMIAS